MDLKLIFTNPLYVSSQPDKDFINFKVMSPGLFKALSDNHPIDKGYEIKRVEVPTQTPSEEAF